MEKEAPLVSVIIPAYNAADYIQRCVNSVRKQTYKKLQIIIVDDGSTDNTFNMCKKYTEEDSRIELYSKENSGVANTRNYGLNCVNGDYVMFVDTDDYIAPNMITLLLSKIRGADFAMCNTVMFNSQNQVVKKSNFEDELINTREFWDYVYNGFWVECIVPWNKLYKKEIFNKLRYPSGKTNEDEYLITKIIAKCTAIQIVKDDLYFHYVNPKSLSNVDNGVGLKFLDAVDAMLDRVQNSLKNQEYYLTDYSLKAVPNLFMKQYSLRNQTKYKKLKKRYFNLYKHSLRKHLISRKTKIRFIIFRYFSLAYFAVFHFHESLKNKY